MDACRFRKGDKNRICRVQKVYIKIENQNYFLDVNNLEKEKVEKMWEKGCL